MIDLHIHILPALDDGAPDLPQAVEMAKLAYAHGTTELVATPHSYARRGYYELYPQDIAETADALQKALAEEGVDIRLHTGMEVLLDASTLPLLADRRMLTLGGTSWLLTEFYGGESAREMEDLLRQVISMGYTPLIAHAERYRAIQKQTDLAQTLREIGCAIQVNARTLSGEGDRKFVKTARRLCEKGYVQVVASDGHNAQSRPPFIDSAYEWLVQTYSTALADLLTHENPRAILSGVKPSELRGMI